MFLLSLNKVVKETEEHRDSTSQFNHFINKLRASRCALKEALFPVAAGLKRLKIIKLRTSFCNWLNNNSSRVELPASWGVYCESEGIDWEGTVSICWDRDFVKTQVKLGTLSSLILMSSFIHWKKSLYPQWEWLPWFQGKGPSYWYLVGGASAWPEVMVMVSPNAVAM